MSVVGQGNYKAIIFLDRDGVINKDAGYLSKVEEFEFLPGVIQGLQKLQKLGCYLGVVTNQSGVDRGYYTEEDVATIHRYMIDELSKNHVTIDAIRYCPDFSETHRKPAPGMLLDILKEGFNSETSGMPIFIIGDKPSDIEAGNAVGAKGIFMEGNYPLGEVGPDYTVGNFLEAVEIIDREIG